MDSTYENVLAARDAADRAGDNCDKMAIYVAQMQGSANYYINQLKLCKEEEKAEAEANIVKHNQALADAHAKWSEALNSQAELWGTYYDLLEEYKNKKQEQELSTREQEYDEMREIIQESDGW